MFRRQTKFLNLSLLCQFGYFCKLKLVPPAFQVEIRSWKKCVLLSGRPVTPVEAGVRSLEFDTATCWQKTRCLVLSPSSCASHRPPERADNESGAVQNPFDRGERDLEVRDMLQVFFNRGSSPAVTALNETP